MKKGVKSYQKELADEMDSLFLEFNETKEGQDFLEKNEQALSEEIAAFKDLSEDRDKQIETVNNIDKFIRESACFTGQLAKWQRMVQFYCVKRSDNNNGICRRMGETYTRLFPEAPMFFELTEKGLSIYIAQEKALITFRNMLRDFNFLNIVIDVECLAPKVPGFETHTQRLIISHLEVPKFLNLHYLDEKPEYRLKQMYLNKKLDIQQCRLFCTRPKVFEEQDFDYYKDCFQKLNNLKEKTQDANEQLLFSHLVEDSSYSANDYRRYLQGLFALSHTFANLTKEQRNMLSEVVQNTLIGLQSQLIVLDEDKFSEITLKLSDYFYKVYDMVETRANKPYVTLMPEDWGFYIDNERAAKMLYEQFVVHDLHPCMEKNDAADAIESLQSYSWKLTIPLCFSHQLLKLGRVNPANIDYHLKEICGKNFAVSLLQSILKTNPNKIQDNLSSVKGTYQVASLINGEQIVRLSLKAVETSLNKNARCVVIILDDSKGMEGDKIATAKQACINLIEELPENTQVILRTMGGGTSFFHCLKRELHSDWKESILGISANRDYSLLLRTITHAGSEIEPDRHFIPVGTLKNSTIILITADCQSENKSAIEILKGLRTGILLHPECGEYAEFRRALGSRELKNHGVLTIVPVGIGLKYYPEFMRELGTGAYYHIREDDNMQHDFQHMTSQVSATLDYKIGPIYAGLFKDKREVTIVNIDAMPVGSEKHICVHVDQEIDPSQFDFCLSVEGQFMHSTSMQPIEISEEAKVKLRLDYFRSEVDALFKELIIRREQKNKDVSLYREIKEKLGIIEKKIEENALHEYMGEEIADFRQLIGRMKYNMADQESDRSQQARVSRGEYWREEKAENRKVETKTTGKRLSLSY